MRVFFAVAETGNLNLLVKSGKPPKDLIELWEAILTEYGKLDGNLLLNDSLEKQKQMVSYAATYVEVTGMLLSLKHFRYREDYITRLSELGYHIDETQYIPDVERNQRTVKNIASRMLMLQKEISSLKEEGSKSSFDDAISYLAANLGSWVPDDITVARYISLKKVIKEKHVANKTK